MLRQRLSSSSFHVSRSACCCWGCWLQGRFPAPSPPLSTKRRKPSSTCSTTSASTTRLRTRRQGTQPVGIRGAAGIRNAIGRVAGAIAGTAGTAGLARSGARPARPASKPRRRRRSIGGRQRLARRRDPRLPPDGGAAPGARPARRRPPVRRPLRCLPWRQRPWRRPAGQGHGAVAAAISTTPAGWLRAACMASTTPSRLGVGGTPMRPFTEFSRCRPLGAGVFRRRPAHTRRRRSKQGEELWKQRQGKERNSRISKQLVDRHPGRRRQKAAPTLASVQAYLTAHPEALQAAAPTPLELTRTQAGRGVQAYRQGDRDGARQLAISAYLEGFELVEAGARQRRSRRCAAKSSAR